MSLYARGSFVSSIAVGQDASFVKRHQELRPARLPYRNATIAVFGSLVEEERCRT